MSGDDFRDDFPIGEFTAEERIAQHACGLHLTGKTLPVRYRLAPADFQHAAQRLRVKCEGSGRRDDVFFTMHTSAGLVHVYSDISVAEGRISADDTKLDPTDPTEDELLRAARWHLLRATIKAASIGDQGAASFVRAYCDLRS